MAGKTCPLCGGTMIIRLDVVAVELIKVWQCQQCGTEIEF